ncbi:GntR family transcriptional regulator [Nocardia concava]|uniref:GntR family transcriptional regulator n=1 Tax=Nocardia concava TaxID=257281 RepID=UPI00030A5311|nr:GntR family transcriptional regulator [Nocardia concava]
MPTDTDAAVGAVQTAIDAVYDLIAAGELRPGQPIRQETLAERLGLSRQPIREALRMLASDGLLTYRRNAGFCARELSAPELEQAYRLRQLLENEILCGLGDITPAVIAELRALNQAIADAATRADLGAIRRLNTEFHFRLFALSGLDLFVAELRRIWLLTSIYRAVYLTGPRISDRIIAEHDAIIDALELRDIPRLVALHNQHREGTITAITTLLTPAPNPLPTG